MEAEGMGQVPIHLMDSSRDAKGFGHGKGYLYPHSFEGHFISQQYLPDHLVDTHFYKPSDQGFEAKVQERVKNWRKIQSDGLNKKSASPQKKPSEKDR
jgi:putative ATPase